MGSPRLRNRGATSLAFDSVGLGGGLFILLTGCQSAVAAFAGGPRHVDCAYYDADGQRIPGIDRSALPGADGPIRHSSGRAVRSVEAPGQNVTALEFQTVSRSYGQRLVVDNLSFRIEKGERVVLHGPSGCGKTT